MSTGNVQIDFEQMLAQLQAQVVGNNSQWQDLVADGTGEALLEFVATAGAYGVYANERALQEAFPDSARLISSVYAAMRLLGIRLSRKLPVSCTATVTKPPDGKTYLIPAYSMFSSPQGTLFNRQAITFTNTNTVEQCTLYAGTVKTVTVVGTGNPLQTFISADANFTVSDQDVLVTVGGIQIPVVTDGLWNYGATTAVVGGVQTTVIQAAVQDKTTNTGALELDFGNDNYGTVPTAGSNVAITYALTNGLTDVNAAFTGTTIAYDNYSSIVATSGLVGGGNQTAPTTYQRIGPGAFASFNRAVNAQEYNAVAVQYPGIVDALIVGQSKIAPTLVTYMNVLRVSLLTASPWTQTQYDTWSTWMQQRSMNSMNFYFEAPQPVNYSVVGSVFCNSTANLSVVEQNVLTALKSVTVPSNGWIGRTTYVSEIIDTIYKADSNVLYVKLSQPSGDFVTAFNLTSIVLDQTGSGSAPTSANLTYYITGINTFSGSPQESLPIVVAFSTNSQAGTGIQLSWDLTSGLVGINIYTMRPGGSVGLIASLPGSATGYFDNYSSTPTSQTYPTIDNFGVWYPNNVTTQLAFFPAADRGTGIGY